MMNQDGRNEEPMLTFDEEQLLTFASSVHRLCVESYGDSALDIVGGLMMSLSESVVKSTPEESSLELLVKNTREILRQVTRITKLSAEDDTGLLMQVERPSLIQQILDSLHLIQKTLTCSWEAPLAHLSGIMGESSHEKTRLLNDPKFLSRITKEVMKQKRILFQQSVDATLDAEQRQDAKQDHLFVEQLLQKLILHQVQLNTDAAPDMDTSESAGMRDESLSMQSIQTTPAQLPAWAVCPVSKKILIDPVTVRADCNHTLSKSVFQEWLDHNNTTCPVCGCKLKALYAKTNPQLQWQLQELENQQSCPVVPTTPADDAVGNQTRRFSTGGFTHGKTVVPKTRKSAAYKAPMALWGEGATGMQQHLINGESLSSIGEHDITWDGSDSQLDTHDLYHSTSDILNKVPTLPKYLPRPETVVTATQHTQNPVSKPGHTIVVTSYPMIDRSKLGKTRRSKNPVKNLYQKVLGKSTVASCASDAMVPAKVMLRLNHSNGSNMTADMSDGSFHQTENINPTSFKSLASPMTVLKAQDKNSSRNSSVRRSKGDAWVGLPTLTTMQTIIEV